MSPDTHVCTFTELLDLEGIILPINCIKVTEVDVIMRLGHKGTPESVTRIRVDRTKGIRNVDGEKQRGKTMDERAVAVTVR